MSKTKQKREIKRQEAGILVKLSETTVSEKTALERPSKVLFDKFNRAEKRMANIAQAERRPVRNKNPLPADFKALPISHPLEEMLDPLSPVNVFSNLRGYTQNLSYDLTGKSLNSEQMPQLLELFELLAEEIRQAAAKDTAPIENLPAFALEYFKWKLGE